MEPAQLITSGGEVTSYAGGVIKEHVIRLNMQYGALPPRGKEQVLAIHSLYNACMGGRELSEDELSWATRKKIIAVGASSTVMALYMQMRKHNCVPTFSGIGALTASVVSEMHWPGVLKDAATMERIQQTVSADDWKRWLVLRELARREKGAPDDEVRSEMEHLLNAYREKVGNGKVKIMIVRNPVRDETFSDRMAAAYAELTPMQKQALVTEMVKGGNGSDWVMDCNGASGSGPTKQVASMMARITSAGKVV